MPESDFCRGLIGVRSSYEEIIFEGLPRWWIRVRSYVQRGPCKTRKQGTGRPSERKKVLEAHVPAILSAMRGKHER
jgi:hypothetical protein